MFAVNINNIALYKSEINTSSCPAKKKKDRKKKKSSFKWSIFGIITWTIDFDHNGPQHRTKFNEIDRFGDKNRVNSFSFNTTILKFSEKFDHPFSFVFIFGNMFSDSHGFVAMPVISCIKDTCSNLYLSN